MICAPEAAAWRTMATCLSIMTCLIFSSELCGFSAFFAWINEHRTIRGIDPSWPPPVSAPDERRQCSTIPQLHFRLGMQILFHTSARAGPHLAVRKPTGRSREAPRALYGARHELS